MSLFVKVLGKTYTEGCKHPAVSGILLPGMATGIGAPQGGELAGRVRACVAYSGQSAEALAAAHTELKVRTLYRYMKDGGPSDANGQARRLQVAKACGVPERFMLEGWPAIEQPREDELAELRRIVRELQQRVGDEGEEPERKPA